MKVTKRELEIMELLEGGAEIFAAGKAREVRLIDERHPGAIEITRPMGNYSESEQLPYFGAILTAKGRYLLKKAREIS